MALDMEHATKPAWQVADQLVHSLSIKCPRLQFSVYVNYPVASTVTTTTLQQEEAYHIIAKNPVTGAIRFRRLVPLRELMSREGHDLLMAQLFLVEPPT